VTVWFGANDGTISSVHVPLERFKANLRAFVATLLDAVGAPRVLLITPPPINVHRHGSRASAARGAASGAAAGGSGGGGPAKDTDVAAAAADGGSGPADGDAPDDDARDAAAVRAARRELGPRVYARKMAYAAAVLDVVGELADPRVAACDVWRAIVLHGLASSKRGTLPAAELCVDRPWEAMVRWRLPGSGLPLAEEFAEGVFTDGLHFGALGYQVVTMAVFDAILEHWPEML
jgi:lysophospholipase L1-like esterase